MDLKWYPAEDQLNNIIFNVSLFVFLSVKIALTLFILFLQVTTDVGCSLVSQDNLCCGNKRTAPASYSNNNQPPLQFRPRVCPPAESQPLISSILILFLF